ncbi:gephyrin-like molybdotransferase Glp [Planktotalea arctica]|uniref:molybdopterin molybdotransferase MoeA n=1 Tax=Planktotalea arctica TaxID=1481893 RepID=UPI000A172BC1|nr:gephyrin-like molybdotransferase Glp [Planktotalea arctica]
MISVEAALAQLFTLIAPLESEAVPLGEAAGRVLAKSVTAKRDQPPFPASAMDGYAIQSADFKVGTRLSVLGEAAAGARFDGSVGAGQAVRIFTGAPVPQGADWIAIQEDVDAAGTQITIRAVTETSAYVRPAGTDFKAGQTLQAPLILTPQRIALLASMNISEVPVTRRPDVALISTGSELVMPGETPGPDQIIASNTFGLKAMLEQLGATVRLLPIAHDTLPALRTAFDLARGADLIVTIGGASVGDHDLVGDVAQELGMQRAFYKVAMRPGKPLMAGRIGNAAMIGLPGNPVSAMVCGTVFVAPMVRAMMGLGQHPAPHQNAVLAQDIPANGPRAHYMRAVLKGGQITPFKRQDSALLSVLAEANALLLRTPHDCARKAGEQVSYVPL